MKLVYLSVVLIHVWMLERSIFAVNGILIRKVISYEKVQ